MDYIFSAEQIEIPTDLPGVMKAWTKEVIRYNPKDVLSFSRQYFEAMSKGSEELEKFLEKHEQAALGVVSSTNRRASVPGPAAGSSMIAKPLLQPGEALTMSMHVVENRDHGSIREIEKVHSDHGVMAAGELQGLAPNDRKRLIYKKAFDRYDRDQSGSMDTSELYHLLADLKWDNGAEALEQACRVLDKDSDGTIDLEEFLTWTEYAWNFQALSGPNRKSSLSVAQGDHKRSKGKRRKSLLDIVGE